MNIRSDGLQTRKMNRNRPDNGDFRIIAMVQFSISGQHAFCAWSNTYLFNMYGMDIATQVVSKTNARFDGERFDCKSTDQTITNYWNCKKESDIPNCKHTQPINNRHDFEWNYPVKDEQMTLAYYGISEEEYQKSIRKPEPPPVAEKPRAPLFTNDQRDLALAIGIPVVLLGVLLIVIRKT